MTWRDWFGLSPSREQFARDLIRQLGDRGVAGWSYDPGESALVHTGARKFFVDNAWREYSSASGAGRRTLLEKYVNVLLTADERIEELWEVAATRLYACIRSRHQLMSLEINSRGTSNALPKPLSKHWHGDLDIVVMYDVGSSLFGVTADAAGPWGQTVDDIFSRAEGNLSALDRPSWQDTGGGVLQLVSDVSFEESFLLVPGRLDVSRSEGQPGGRCAQSRRPPRHWRRRS